MPDPLYFLHIPKTGGVSVTQWLTDTLPSGMLCPAQLWDDLAAGRAAQLATYGAFHGHFGADMERLLGRRTRTITVLRDPLARTVSHYRHVKRDTFHPWHRRVSGQSFDDFVGDPTNWPMIENFQARYLAGLPMDLAPFLAACDGPARHGLRLTVAIEELGFCLAPEYLRRTAMERLRTACVVGTTEHLTDFCRKVAQVFGLPFTGADDVAQLNAAGKGGAVEPSDGARALVEGLTAIDRALYLQACDQSSAGRPAAGAQAAASTQSVRTRPHYADALLDGGKPARPYGTGAFLHVAKLEDHEPLLSIETEASPTRVLVLKLDHRGDFINALPAFAALRQGFPDARLTLACGPWMETEAKALGVFDEILPVAFFPEVASAGQDGNFHDDGTSRFEATVADRHWDLAIDLRVDRDTRHLLAKVDATHRAGFGTAIEFPFLDIFLPYQTPTVEGRAYRQMLAPTSFTAAIGKHAGYAIIHEADHQTRQAADFLVYGPYLTFAPGHWTFEVLIEPTATDFDVHFDICADQGRQLIMVGKLDVSANRHPRFAITLVEAVERMEIRLRAAATGVLPPFRFLGMRCYRPGILPALHQQEMQLLLASLVGLRMKAPYVVHEIAA